MVNSTDEMRPLLTKGEADNLVFKKFLRQKSTSEVQTLAEEISIAVEKEIDCTQCGNCCRKLKPGMSNAEACRLSELSEMPSDAFFQQHLLNEGDHCYMKNKPCYFLHGNICSIYDERPESCRDYPHLRSGHFKYKRSIWINYAVCPIVFNTIEIMKIRTGYKEGNENLK